MADKRVTEIKSIITYHGYELQGKLDLPLADTVSKLVYYVNSSGPHTYDDHRIYGDKEFNYYDLFAEQFTKRGIGFFRHNTRGVTPGSESPNYCNISEDIYATYLPENSIRDVEDWIKYLRQDIRLRNAEIYLLGWSEGSMIAPAVAVREREKIDGLLLAGYANGTMEEVLDWQQSGESSMIFYRRYFDYDGDSVVSKVEFDEDRYGIREYIGAAFEDIDIDKDGLITVSDFKTLLEPGKKVLYAAIDSKDEAWLEKNYPVRLTPAWFHAHKTLSPNHDTMKKIDLPIHIFHGKWDANADVQGVIAIDAEFQRLKKNNLAVHIYDNADHDLNYMQYIAHGVIPQPLIDLFNVVQCM